MPAEHRSNAGSAVDECKAMQARQCMRLPLGSMNRHGFLQTRGLCSAPRLCWGAMPSASHSGSAHAGSSGERASSVYCWLRLLLKSSRMPAARGSSAAAAALASSERARRCLRPSPPFKPCSLLAGILF